MHTLPTCAAFAAGTERERRLNYKRAFSWRANLNSGHTAAHETLTLKSERSALLHFSVVPFACSDALLSRWNIFKEGPRANYIFLCLEASEFIFFSSLCGKQICGRVFLLRACSLAKNLQVRQKAEAEKEATNCVASDEESCRHVYKALAHSYLCGSIAGCFLIIIHQRPYTFTCCAPLFLFLPWFVPYGVSIL
jgi:hypothetical protein